MQSSNAPLAVNHQGQFPVVTLSFNLAPGASLGDATKAIQQAEKEIQMPPSIHASFQGTAAAFQNSLSSEPFLILAAIITVYIVLGVLYESYIHPITILSTLPSAGVGAILALMITGNDLTVVALIGIILLIGIVKKNAIMMIDFALEAEREEHKPPEEAIFQACLLRFRPIMMTTMAALLGGLPLALGIGNGRGVAAAAGHHDRGRIDCSASCSRSTPRRWFTCGLTGWRTGLRSTGSAIRFRMKMPCGLRQVPHRAWHPVRNDKKRA